VTLQNPDGRERKVVSSWAIIRASAQNNPANEALSENQISCQYSSVAVNEWPLVIDLVG
jgi:hypothetical protein